MVSARYAPDGGLVPQGISAEMIADKWGITREDMDAFGARSQELAARATREGRFQGQIHPVMGADGNMVTQDEGIRETTIEKLASLKPAFKPLEDKRRALVPMSLLARVVSFNITVKVSPTRTARRSSNKPL
jgi:acetyl-CoA acetyltransferase